MRYPLPVKLFVALFGTVCVAVSLIVIRTGSGLRTGYEEYANTAALSNMDGLVQQLEDIYAANRGWSVLAGKPQIWIGLLRSAEVASDDKSGVGLNRPPPDQPPPGVLANGSGRPATVNTPEEQYNFVRYFALQDMSHHAIFGVPSSMPHAAHRALWVDGRQIGWLLFDPGSQVAGLQAGFLAQRVRDLYYTATAALLFSALAAAIMSRNLLVPIRATAQAARQLAAGNYRTRIDAPRADELGDLERDINQLAVALQTAAESQRRWVTDTSHELRTPLAVMRAQIEALQDGVYPVTETAFASLQQQVQRLTRLVDDLHELSRADAGALALRLEPVRPGVLLADVLEGFVPLREARSLTLDAADLGETVGDVWADPERLRQVFTNVVQNAIAYTDPGGMIRASVQPQGKMVLIAVEDSMPGVPAVDQARLFDRFFRTDTSRNRQTGGSGLGLAICRAIVTAHGGTIAAGDSPLGGVAISIALPAAGSAAR